VIKSYMMHSVNRCKFAGQICSMEMLNETFTDMGRCYVFNNDPNDRQFSNASGLWNRFFYLLFWLSAFFEKGPCV